MRFSALIPCGPSPRELGRLADLVGALRQHEPDCERIVVVTDDNPQVSEWGKAAGLKVLSGARDGRGWGVGGGLVTNQLGGYEWLFENARDSRFVLRLDTDAAILGPFSEPLRVALEPAEVGMVGSLIDQDQLGPARRSPGIGYFASKVRKLVRPVALWRQPRWHLRSLTSSAARQLAADIRSARNRGYRDGMVVEGGSFALGWNWLERADREGLFRDKQRFAEAPVTEDVVMTILTYRLGLEARNCELFCIEPEGLRHAPRLLLDQAGDSPIIHSVKAGSPAEEAALRRELGLFRSPGESD